VDEADAEAVGGEADEFDEAGSDLDAPPEHALATRKKVPTKTLVHHVASAISQLYVPGSATRRFRTSTVIRCRAGEI
jgi:hypothetical protein